MPPFSSQSNNNQDLIDEILIGLRSFGKPQPAQPKRELSPVNQNRTNPNDPTGIGFKSETPSAGPSRITGSGPGKRLSPDYPGESA